MISKVAECNHIERQWLHLKDIVARANELLRLIALGRDVEIGDNYDEILIISPGLSVRASLPAIQPVRQRHGSGHLGKDAPDSEGCHARKE